MLKRESFAFAWVLVAIGIHADSVRSRLPASDYNEAMMAAGLHGMLEPEPELWCERWRPLLVDKATPCLSK